MKRKFKEKRQEVEYYETVVDYLQEIVKQIGQRNFQIKNAIEWRKFEADVISLSIRRTRFIFKWSVREVLQENSMSFFIQCSICKIYADTKIGSGMVRLFVRY